jgi:hypothetical protein
MTMKAMVSWIKRSIRESRFYWRYVADRKPWLEYQLRRLASDSLVQRTIVEQLRRDGVSITTVGSLFQDTRCYDELDAEVRKLERKMAEEIMEGRQRRDGEAFKNYLTELLGPRPVLDPESNFVRIALAPEVLDVANRYFGMMTRLRFFNVWLNFATAAPPKNSQLWHRDPEDRYILKMFIYLSDVDDESGPFFYAPGTHSYGRIRRQPESFGEPGTTARRSDDKQMAAVVPEDKWVKAIGPQGTIVFADTRGYHKGGLAKTKDRLVYNCMFTSQATSRGDYFARSPGLVPPADRATAFALGF